MAKTCTTCGGAPYAKGFCKIHYKMPSQLNPKPIARKQMAAVAAVKRPAIKLVSDRRAKELRVYAKICPAFKKANPECQAKLPGCTVMTTDVHHKWGKENERLNMVEHFLAVCRHCHDVIGGNHTMAKEKGFSINRTFVI
ncbi:hypothetical protein [Pedobacter cryoconitis]|uniref:Uncharacterized protein n=1 Tax=Pedobacter cryoconitis TaxID=188932 RepID=A0A327SIE8_9SPHI|nr:hypothetical protein [Pedobacter cryoconitis]RAJ28896.1 hypothetical protein LY11_03170 [Pedobacter cryoconitis]